MLTVFIILMELDEINSTIKRCKINYKFLQKPKKRPTLKSNVKEKRKKIMQYQAPRNIRNLYVSYRLVEAMQKAVKQSTIPHFSFVKVATGNDQKSCL